MKPSRQWILYTLLRVGIFAVVFAICMLAGAWPWVAAIIAAIVGLCVTYLFFPKQREAVAISLYEYRHAQHPDEDSDAENRALDEREER